MTTVTHGDDVRFVRDKEMADEIAALNRKWAPARAAYEAAAESHTIYVHNRKTKKIIETVTADSKSLCEALVVEFSGLPDFEMTFDPSGLVEK